MPEADWGRAGIATSRAVVYVLLDVLKGAEGGLYRSDDRGSSWRRVSDDKRIFGRQWYFGEITADPNNPNIVYAPNVALYKSSDGGKTFAALKGAPGGDDYHFLWLDPDDAARMIVASDQGTIVSVDGGKTWTSWFNQPTAQFYHVATDNQFPYYVYGAQQDSGTVATTSRSDYGSITYRDWYSVGGGGDRGSGHRDQPAAQCRARHSCGHPADPPRSGSYRSVDVIVKAHPLRALVQELRVRRQCEDIALAFLREPHVAAYLAQRFGGHAFPSELARAVHQRTDGNPLLMVRVVEELVALRVLEPEDDRWRLRRPVAEITRAVPESLRALIEKQIDRLQPEAQRLLEAASVLGNEFTIGSVAAGLGADPLTIEECCDELTRQGQFLTATGLFVRPDGTQVARYRFTHSLYPHAIAARVPAGSRMRLHQRVGEWLEHTYGAQATVIAASLAWHFEEAGDYHRAIRYLILTAGNAAGRCAYGDAIRVLQHGRSLVDRLAANARSAVEIELLHRIGDAHFGRGAMVECAEAYEAAAARAADAGLTSAQVDALNSLVRPFCFIDPDRAIAAIEQAVHLSANLGDPLLHARTELLAAYVRLTFDTWRMKDWEICASASETIHRLSAAGPPAFDRVIYAHVQILRGDYAEALKNLEAGIPNENESASGVVHFLAFSGKLLALLLLGRLGELVQLLRAGREIAEKNENEPWLFVFREAWLHMAVLDFAGAGQLCEGMVARSADAYWQGQSQTIGGIARGHATLEQGKYDDALRSFAHVLDPKKRTKFFLHWYWRMNAELGLSNVWLASGNLRKAGLEAERFLQSALSTAEPNLQALAWELGARVAMAEKDWEGAEEKIEKGLAIVQEFEIPTTAWRVHATGSDMYRQTKNETAAEAHRVRAEAIVLALANSFGPDDPLRHAFLAAAPVRRILGVRDGTRGGRQRRVPR